MDYQIEFLDTLPTSTLDLLHWLSQIAYKVRVSIFIVGGFVRDLIMHRINTDFDIIVEGDAIQFARSLSSIYGGKLVIHPSFGTATWDIHTIYEKIIPDLKKNGFDPSISLPHHIDFISSREEIYPHPAALPVVRPGGINADLCRRDFTINTLAMSLVKEHFGELIDPHHGYEDIQDGLIRVLHDRSFMDDPTRQLRAIRFEQRFGFRIEDHTLALMRTAETFLKDTTGIRLRHELDLMFREELFNEMLVRASELGLLTAIHPSLSWSQDLTITFNKIDHIHWDKEWGIKPTFGRMGFKTGMKYCLWLSTFSNDVQSSLAQRLSIPRAILEAAKKNLQLRGILKELPDKLVSQITFTLDEFPLFVILACLNASNDHGINLFLNKYLFEWRRILQLSDGEDLKKLGLPLGPAYKEILRNLRAAWLDGQIHSMEEEKVLLRQFLIQKGMQPRD
jgi:tRNA nucleotidyltransferase (CCA-adding enzyme)